MDIDKFPRNQGEFNNFDERYEFCRKLAPRIVQATGDFYDPEQPHPFLDSLAGGGHIISHPDKDTEDTEYLTIVEASGFRDTLAPEDFETIGIPKEVASSGQMWSVSKREVEYQKDRKINPIQKSSENIDHCFAYWDGSQWHARRIKDNASEFELWEDQWAETDLTEEETAAISSVATQTQDIQSIAEIFEGDTYAFRKTFLEVLENEYGLTDERKKRFGDCALGTLFPNDALPTYTVCHGTAYQSRALLDTAYKLSRGNSHRLDSGDIVNARYHTQSTPFTSEMLDEGVEIPQRSIHPPVPFGFVEK